MICRASHSAVGCRVTSNHNSCRRRDPEPGTQTRDQRSASAQRTHRWQQSPQRDFAEKSSRVATAASKVALYISRPWTEPPQSQASEARHESGMRPKVGSHCSSAGSKATINPRPPCPMTRFPTPKHFEPRAMPTQDGLRLNHLNRINKARPKPRHPYEQRAITAKQSEPM